MKKRMLLMLAAVGIVVATLAAVKTRQFQAGMKQQASFQPPPEAVTTVIAKTEAWPFTWNAIGSVAAVHGVTVSADLPGLVHSIEFESGQSVPAGAVLVRLDMKQEEAQLASAEAARALAELNAKRAKDLVAQGIQSQSDLDQLASQQKQAEARVGELKATIARKTIRAPFAGVLGIRQVNLGQYLEAGAAIVPLQSIRPVYVNFSVPQQEIVNLKVGSVIRVVNENAADKSAQSDGRVTAIDSIINETTRNVQVQATFANADAKLKPGQFVKATVGIGQGSSAITIPTSAINYAPYGDSVFVVEDKKDESGAIVKGPDGKPAKVARQQFVRLGVARGDFVAIDKGVQPGQVLVTAGAFKLRNGSGVVVNNAIKPSPSLDPQVPNL